MVIKFKDGMEFNTDGPLRTDQRSDGLYVVGHGMLIPVKDEDDARDVIASVKKNEAHYDSFTEVE